MGHCVKGTDRGKQKGLKKNLHQCHLSVTNAKWTGSSKKPNRCGGRSAVFD
jgi:hypothetical protein